MLGRRRNGCAPGYPHLAFPRRRRRRRRSQPAGLKDLLQRPIPDRPRRQHLFPRAACLFQLLGFTGHAGRYGTCPLSKCSSSRSGQSLARPSTPFASSRRVPRPCARGGGAPPPHAWRAAQDTPACATRVASRIGAAPAAPGVGHDPNAASGPPGDFNVRFSPRSGRGARAGLRLARIMTNHPLPLARIS